MRDFLYSILVNLVQNEDRISIQCAETDDVIDFSVKVASEDTGRVIGKAGSIANSIRIILKAASPKLGSNKAILFEIVEEVIDNWNPDLR